MIVKKLKTIQVINFSSINEWSYLIWQKKKCFVESNNKFWSGIH